MAGRTKIVQTETDGEYGEQSISHGKSADGKYRPIALTDTGLVRISPVSAAVIPSSINDASATTTKFVTDLTETMTGFWIRAALRFTSGNNNGQIRAIKAYDGTTKEITIQTPLSYAPADNDTFEILPIRKFLTPNLAGIWDKLLTDHTVSGSAGKKLSDIPTTAMRGTNDAFLATDGANLPDDADVEDLPWEATVSSHQVAGTTGEAIGISRDSALANYGLLIDGTYGLSALKVLIDVIDGVVDAIKLKTDNLPTDPADESLLEAEINANETKIDTVDGVVDGIQTDLNNATDGLGALKSLIDALPNDANIGDLPWEETMSEHTDAGTCGIYLYLAYSRAHDNYTNITSGIHGLAALRSEINANETKIDTLQTLLETMFPALTVAGFQKNAATGVSCAACDNINDNDTGSSSYVNAVAGYWEIDFGCMSLIKQFRHYGHANNELDGVYKMQYLDLGSNSWVDWKTGIATRGTTWTNFEEVYPVATTKLRVVVTTLDTAGAAYKNWLRQWEVKY